METKHTKGKWFACCKDEKPHFIFSDGGYTICKPIEKQDMNDDIPHDEFIANCKLIESAPELLATLIKVQKDMEQDIVLPSTLNTINNLITKLTK
jgi:hypothetical protein